MFLWGFVLGGFIFSRVVLLYFYFFSNAFGILGVFFCFVSGLFISLKQIVDLPSVIDYHLFWIVLFN